MRWAIEALILAGRARLIWAILADLIVPVRPAYRVPFGRRFASWPRRTTTSSAGDRTDECRPDLG
jgi:hypothetical protein